MEPFGAPTKFKEKNMSYPVDIKTVNITSATTTTIHAGSARILGLSWVVPTNVAAGS